jgi:hypothetical protein
MRHDQRALRKSERGDPKAANLNRLGVPVSRANRLICRVGERAASVAHPGAKNSTKSSELDLLERARVI